MSHKDNFLAAKKAGDWNKVFEILKAVAAEADIELTSLSSGGADLGEEAAAKKNAQQGEHTAYGRKI